MIFKIETCSKIARECVCRGGGGDIGGWAKFYIIKSMYLFHFFLLLEGAEALCPSCPGYTSGVTRIFEFHLFMYIF